MLMGVYLHVNHLLFSQGAIHKRRLLKGGGRGGGQKLPILLSKKPTKGEGGGHKIQKMGRRCLWMAP